jgi:hypothetical protein
MLDTRRSDTMTNRERSEWLIRCYILLLEEAMTLFPNIRLAPFYATLAELREQRDRQ